MVPHPFIYEINTWVWLDELSRREGTPIDLAGVPGHEWDAIAALGFDAVWLMGVWERSPAGIAIALENAGPDRELPASAARLHDRRTSSARRTASATTRSTPHLGGPAGLAAARAALAERGVGLILDFVPNHVAPDHPWTAAHPGVLRRAGATTTSRATRPRSCASAARVLANGRDPYFPAWPDVVQLNAFSPDLRARRDRDARRDRRAVRRRPLRHGDADDERHLRADLGRARRRRAGGRLLADRDPGRAGAPIPDFVFMAEAYWDLEWALQQQGFDYCYDKRLYDRLVHERRRGRAAGT